MLESDLLQSLKQVDEKLYQKYSKLSELELDGQVASAQYAQTIKEIEVLCALEEDVLFKIASGDVDINQMEEILNQEETSSNIHIINRISKLLANFSSNEKQDFYDEEFEDYFDFMDAFTEELPKEDISKLFISEFLVRLQERIDYSETDKKLLIKNKYDTCFENYNFDEDLLTVRFNVRNFTIPTIEQLNDEADVDRVTGTVSLAKFLQEAFWQIINDLISTEHLKASEEEKRAIFKVLDLQLEIVLSYFDFETIFSLKSQIDSTNIVDDSVSADIIYENIDEALIERASHKSKIEKAYDDLNIKIKIIS